MKTYIQIEDVIYEIDEDVAKYIRELNKELEMYKALLREQIVPQLGANAS